MEDVTYLVVMKEAKKDIIVQDIPIKVIKVLDEFKDIILSEPLKKLLPRREVDHAINLESRAKPYAMSIILHVSTKT